MLSTCPEVMYYRMSLGQSVRRPNCMHQVTSLNFMPGLNLAAALLLASASAWVGSSSCMPSLPCSAGSVWAPASVPWPSASGLIMPSASAVCLQRKVRDASWGGCQGFDTRCITKNHARSVRHKLMHGLYATLTCCAYGGLSGASGRPGSCRPPAGRGPAPPPAARTQPRQRALSPGL